VGGIADHQNAVGDDEGSVAVVGSDGKTRRRYFPRDGPKCKEFSGPQPAMRSVYSTHGDSGATPRAVTLSAQREPSRMCRRNVLRRCAERCGVDRNNHRRIGIRGWTGRKEERELGWLDWSVLDDITPDGREILFDEAGAGGGVNYTAFVRGSDGSAPVRIGEGSGLGISADGKWVIMQAAKGGPLRVVPTGAGEARQLTHDNVSYQRARWLAAERSCWRADLSPDTGRAIT